MPSLPTYAAAAFLALHGVVHLLGTAVYLELADLANFPYKTTLLGGRWDVGAGGFAFSASSGRWLPWGSWRLPWRW